MAVRDVALQTNENIFRFESGQWRSIPDDKFWLADDVWVGKLEVAVAKQVIDACEPPGKYRVAPVRQYGQLCTFVLELGNATPYGWDEEHRLSHCIALSRIVRPTTVSHAYAARITAESDGARIDPGPVQGHFSQAFISDASLRDWLDQADLELLRILLKQFRWSEIPSRVQRAMRLHENAAHREYLEIMWPMIVTAIEALVHTDRRHSTSQFVMRTAALATEIGMAGVSEDALNKIYDLRSSYVHGQGSIKNLKGDELELFDCASAILRGAIRKAIEDTSFRDVFADDDKIRSRWPIA